MASDFAAQVVAHIDDGTEVLEYTPSQVAGETAARVGELMFVDVAASMVAKRCGADPALIAGISEVVSESARVLTPNGKIPLRLLKTNATVRMCSATTPVYATHVGVAYGIVRLASGAWAVDTGDVAATRVVVKDVDIPSGSWFVSFLAANLQFDAIAS